jgi:predicted metalloprotease with PDZ domain
MRIFKLFRICLFIVLIPALYSQSEVSENTYYYSINLNEVKDHKLEVRLNTPEINNDEVIFRMPKMVPGTYHVYNFGRFVSDFTAYDMNDGKLPVESVDNSSWKISNAGNLDRITYKVHETWEPENKTNFVFEPVGTSFDDSSYVLNANAIFGYFDGMIRNSYEISITKPLNFYGSSAMEPAYSDAVVDKFIFPDYHVLVDMPILYTRPDTTVLKIGETDVLISVYSENKIITSKMLAAEIQNLLEAQRSYLGGTLPVTKYAYLVYFAETSGSGHAGALEHSTSSLYFLIEGDPEQVIQSFVSPAAHEFFHIVTPLTIQSEEIYDFDFVNPKMSKHLWLYEGVTEYSAGIVMVKEGLMNRNAFLEWIKNKILVAGYFNDTLPFTEMSKNILDKYEKLFINVYFKGALIGMCLDIKLRSLSDGKYGVKDLLAELSRRFGIGKPFKDDELFDIIAGMTYPEIRNFFKDYVEGPNPLPLEEIFALAGVKYIKVGKEKEFTLGNISLEINTNSEYVKIVSTDGMNSFGKEMGYKEGDEIISINGIELKPSEYSEFIQELFSESKEGDEIVMEVLRQGKNGKSKKVTLKARMMKVERNVVNNLKYDSNATEQQLRVREGWLGKN